MALASAFRAIARLALLILAGGACADAGDVARLGPAAKQSAASSAAWAWKRAPFIEGRESPAMAALAGKLVIFGGSVMGRARHRYLNDTWEWDGSDWKQKYPRVSPSPREGACFEALGGKLVLFGGFSGGYLDETWEYDGNGWELKRPTSRPTPRVAAGCAVAGTKLVLFGGCGQSGALDDTWEWDGETWTKRSPTTVPPAAYNVAMGTRSDTVLMLAGRVGSEPNDLWEWDGENWMRRAAAATTPQGASPSFVEVDGRLLLLSSYGTTAKTGIWEWDGTGWREQGAPAAAPARHRGYGLASLGKSVFLFGGGLGSMSSNELWEWDGAAWTDRSEEPAPRVTAAMAKFGAEVVLFGGRNETSDWRYSDTWIWSGKKWYRPHTIHVPPVLEYPVMAELGARVVMLGSGGGSRERWDWNGSDWLSVGEVPTLGLLARRDERLVLFNAISKETWESDGSSWEKKAPRFTPPYGRGHAMASFAGKVVLFESETMDDHWEWDGKEWTERVLQQPKPTAGANVLAALENRLMLYGDSGTWQWDGAEWTQLAAPHTPLAYGASMARDEKGLVLFGGWWGSGTWLYRPLAPQGSPCVDALECATDFCVDGVCCDKPCEGKCEACSVAGVEGTCVPVVGAPLGNRSACAGDGSECAGFCDGQNPDACAFPGTDRLCRVASCGLGEMTLEARCDGSGACPAPETSPCGPYACSATTCATSCETSAQCTAGHYCSDGTCVPALALAATCFSDAECASGHCSDGVCCASACAEICLACDVAGSIGQCVAVDGAPHGSRPACEGGASCVSGSCPQAPVEEEQSEGCGCGTAASPMALLGLLALPGLRWRRRGSWQRRA